MPYDRILRGGRLALPTGLIEGDLAIQDGRIAALGQVNDSAAVIEDISGLVVLPGVIDTQVHFREPGLTHKEDLATGTLAALHGGVTGILEMPNTSPPTTTEEALNDKLTRAAGRAWCHYGFFVGAGSENVSDLARLETLPGTPGVKIFMGSSTGSLLVPSDEDLEKVLRSGRKRCPVHAEDEQRNRERKALLSSSPSVLEHPFLRDAESARLATERLLRLSKATGRPVHILHISTRDELELLSDAKVRSLKTTCEATPQHLWFSAPGCYERLGTLVQMNPPIRSEEHRQGIWGAVQDGLFDVFGSDHAPHTLEEKAQAYPSTPSGMPGVQTLLPAILTFCAKGLLPYPKAIGMLTHRASELYGIRGKGRLEVGWDADLTLVDLEARYVWERAMNKSKCGWSPYEGEEFVGRVEHVLLNGEYALYSRQEVDGPKGRMLTFDA